MAFIHILDLIGVFAFSVYGAHKAIIARFDLLGVLFCGALTAFGGGTIRELILNGTPVYLSQCDYLLAAAAGVLVAIALHEYFRKLEKYLIVLDAVGIAVFAYVGASRAADAQLGLAAMMLFAFLTAAGGGIISDIVSGYRPEALYKDFYPLAALSLALEYYLLQPAGQIPAVALLLITTAFALRLISVYRKWKLWKPCKRVRLGIPIIAVKSGTGAK